MTLGNYDNARRAKLAEEGAEVRRQLYAAEEALTKERVRSAQLERAVRKLEKLEEQVERLQRALESR